MWADIIIISSLAIIVALIVYSHFYNRRKYGVCSSCSEMKKCEKKGTKLADEYRKTYACYQKKEGE